MKNAWYDPFISHPRRIIDLTYFWSLCRSDGINVENGSPLLIIQYRKLFGMNMYLDDTCNYFLMQKMAVWFTFWPLGGLCANGNLLYIVIRIVSHVIGLQVTPQTLSGRLKIWPPFKLSESNGRILYKLFYQIEVGAFTLVLQSWHILHIQQCLVCSDLVLLGFACCYL